MDLTMIYHFMIKELAEEFKKQFTCRGEITEKFRTFAVSVEREFARINKNGEQITNFLHITIFW